MCNTCYRSQLPSSKPAPCVECGRTMKISSKGLCHTCYKNQLEPLPPNGYCEYCEKPIHITSVAQKRNTLNFCSHLCFTDHRKVNGLMAGENNPAFAGGPLELVCNICKTPFTRNRSRYIASNIRHYCSKECMGQGVSMYQSGKNSPNYKGKWSTKPCDHCNAPLTRPDWAFREMAFCNIQCFNQWRSHNWGGENNPSWKGGHAKYYGPNWKRQARRTRARDGHKCQRCGIAEDELCKALDVHHITRFINFNGNWKKANLLKNLISYCHPCHMVVEHQKNPAD